MYSYTLFNMYAHYILNLNLYWSPLLHGLSCCRAASAISARLPQPLRTRVTSAQMASPSKTRAATVVVGSAQAHQRRSRALSRRHSSARSSRSWAAWCRDSSAPRRWSNCSTRTTTSRPSACSSTCSRSCSSSARFALRTPESVARLVYSLLLLVHRERFSHCSPMATCSPY